MKRIAIALYFKIFFHIQELKVVLSLTGQNEFLRIKYLLIHLTHRYEFDERILQTIFRHETSFTSFIDRNPNPLSSLGLQQSFHETFAFLLLKTGPYHKKAAHRLSISAIHFFGSLNAEIQKFVKLCITEAISCSLLAKERNLAVQELILDLIFSISGA